MHTIIMNTMTTRSFLFLKSFLCFHQNLFPQCRHWSYVHHKVRVGHKRKVHCNITRGAICYITQYHQQRFALSPYLYNIKAMATPYHCSNIFCISNRRDIFFHTHHRCCQGLMNSQALTIATMYMMNGKIPNKFICI